jgi:hypothetical protein
MVTAGFSSRMAVSCQRWNISRLLYKLLLRSHAKTQTPNPPLPNWPKSQAELGEAAEDLVDSHKARGCLIFLDAQDDTVNLIHQSAKDYLLSPHLQQHQKLAVYSIVQENADLFLFESCWKCLSLYELDPKSDELSMWFPAYCMDSFRPFHLIRFLDYAAERLSFHALAARRVLEKGHVWKDSYLDKRPLLRDFGLDQVSANGYGVVTQLLLEQGANVGARVKTNRMARQP